MSKNAMVFRNLTEQKQHVTKRILEHKDILERKEHASINPKKYAIATAMFESQRYENASVLTEANTSGDVSGVTPLLIPVLRRMIPGMLAFEICGVQPMSAPTGLVFAIRPVFQNSSNKPVKRNNSVIITIGVDGTDDTGVATDFTVGKTITGGKSSATGEIVFKPSADSTVMLVKVTSGTFEKGEELSNDDNTPLTITANAVDSNVAMYKNLLTGYAGTFDTAYAEYLGNDIKELGMTIESISVTAKSMRLKARYTLEIEQDLKNLHGLDASNELQTFLSQEIATEINADLLTDIKAYAKTGGEYLYNYDMNVSDGRWMLEKFRAIYHIIEVAANDIYISTRRGKGNILVVSPNVCSVLAQLPSFYSYNPSIDTLGNAKLSSNYSQENGFAGVFGSFKVYVDPWATEEYAVVGYKGESEFDAGLFYCPYTPIVTTVIPEPETGQKVIHFMTRYGKVENPFGARNFFRYISVVDLPLNIVKTS